MVHVSPWFRSAKHENFRGRPILHIFSPSTATMPHCPTCSFEFFRVDEGSMCGKCRAKVPGLSSIELRLINVSSVTLDK